MLENQISNKKRVALEELLIFAGPYHWELPCAQSPCMTTLPESLGFDIP